MRSPSAASSIELNTLSSLQNANLLYILLKKVALFFASLYLKNSRILAFSSSFYPTGTLKFLSISRKFLSSLESVLAIKSSFPNMESRYFFKSLGVSFSGLVETNTGIGFMYYFPSLDLLSFLTAFIIFINVSGVISGQSVPPKKRR